MCLDSLITYKKSCMNGGDAVYMVQHLPFISSDFAANIANVDTVSGEGVFNEALHFATQLLKERLRTLITGFTVPESIYDGCGCSVPALINDVQFITSNNALGIRIDTKKPSAYGKTKINNLRLLTSVDTEGTVITIQEANGEQTTFTVNLTANAYNEIETNYYIKTNYVKIFTDSIPLAKFSCYSNKQSGCGCGGSSKSKAETGQNKVYSIVSYDGGQPNIIKNDNLVYGFQPCISYECDTDLIFCKYRQRLALPLLYLTGAQMLERAINNPRLNVTTITDLEQRVNTIASAYDKAEEYIRIAGATISESIRQTKGDDCVICDGYRVAWATG